VINNKRYFITENNACNLGIVWIAMSRNGDILCKSEVKCVLTLCKMTAETPALTPHEK